jgi:hypothetical protein
VPLRGDRYAALLAILIVWCSAAARGQDSFRADLQQLATAPARLVGSPGYDAAVGYVERQIKQLPNVEYRRQEFPLSVPVTRSATVTIGGAAEPIYPFWPAQTRVNATPVEGITGKLIYVGTCHPDELRPAALAGQVAVVEASAAERWVAPFMMGAKAELVLGSADTGWAELKGHDLRIPVNFPRFYVPPGALADRLRSKAELSGTVRASVSWETRTAVNLIALVKWTGTDPAGALAFSVPMDATSLVPDLSPGAGQAVQTAAGLSLLRRVAAKPWARPVVVCFGSGDGMQFQGTRQMFLALATVPASYEDDLADLATRRSGADGDLSQARAIVAASADRVPAGDAHVVGRISQIIDTELAQDQEQLFRLRGEQPDGADPAAGDIARLDQRHLVLQRLKFDLQQGAPVTDADEAGEFHRCVRRVVDRLGGMAGSPGLCGQLAAREQLIRQRIDLYRWLAAAERKKTDPVPPGETNRLIDLLVGIDLSDHGSRVGPMFIGTFQRASAFGQIQAYNDWFGQLQRDAAAPANNWWAKLRGVVDLSVLAQVESPASYLAAPLPIGSELATAWATPGLSMITLDDLRARRDTPTDTLANLEVDAIVPQLDGVAAVFQHLWNEKRLRVPAALKQQQVSFGGQVVGAAPGDPVPDLPREGFLATYAYLTANGTGKRIPPMGPLPWTLGVRRTEVQATDAEGNYLFEGIPRLRSDHLEGPARAQNDMQVFAVGVSRADPTTGAITATNDMGRAAGDMRSALDIKQDTPDLRSVAFDCREFSLAGLYDPRFLQGLAELVPLDARRGSEPQHYGFWLDNQMMAGYLEPDVRADLLVRYGREGNRLILVNMPDATRPAAGGHPQQRLGDGQGYTAAQLNGLGWLPLATSRDFWRLDDRRLNDYRSAGVSSPLIDRLHNQAKASLEAAGKALTRDSGPGLVRNSLGAWASEARVYDAAQDMAKDVVRAALVLLILCVPFAFCMERLLLASTDVYRQIGGVAGIFGMMAAGLWAFHPAFKISASPLIIILAFAIISMACLVIAVVYGKFDSELKRLRSGRGSAPSTSFASSGVMMSAILLGIANMRKRKFRTLLTSATVVLITFVLLWFTSTSHYLGTTTVSTGVATPHPGVLLRQRGFRPIPPVLTDQVRTVLADPALKLGAVPRVVERWWATSSVDPKEAYNLVVPGSPSRTTSVPGVLGLSPGESELSSVAEVIGPEKFARLEGGERDVIYLSASTAAELNVAEGGHVRLGGIDLQVAGVYDGDAFDRQVTMLSGEPVTPLKYSSGGVDSGGQQLDDSTADALDLNGGASAAEASSVYEHLSGRDVAIVPADVCRRLRNATLRAVDFRLKDQAQVQAVSEELTRRYALATFAGYDDGVRLVAAGNLASVSGAAQVVVPLLIAAMIIFNTMMGSIADRRREIHVYTSLGLAPAHVGALFVAEAMTYGLIGTVFGYVLGQGIGTLLLKWGWLGTITLNYSGSSAMLTIGLVLGIVFLSALVPARTATRIAAPSIDRTWKVPEPKDGVIRAELPFTINRTAAAGALAYLREFFAAHEEGSIGKFAADHLEVIAHTPVGSPLSSPGLKCTVWLTPYDLGVRQGVELLVYPGRDAEVYEVSVVVTRLGGDDRNWHRMNKTFLTEVRKQFLAWRSLPTARMREYVEQSEQLLRGGRDVPVGAGPALV